MKTYENANNIKCPYCHSLSWKISEEDEDKFDGVDELEDGEEIELKCNQCNSIFDVECSIEEIIETEYYVREKIQPKDIILDMPGQMFLWTNLNLGGVRIY